MFNKINSTFGQRTGPHCNQELENQKAINCFPVAEKGNKSKGLFKGEEIRQLYCLTVTVYGLELQLQIIILKGVLPEGWAVSGSCWGSPDCQSWSIGCCGCSSSRSLLIAGLQSDAAAPLLLLGAGGIASPRSRWALLGGGLLRHRSCALFQDREGCWEQTWCCSEGGESRLPGMHRAESSTALSRAAGRARSSASPAPSTSRHRITSEPSSVPLKAALSPCSDPEGTFCHILGLVHQNTVSGWSGALAHLWCLTQRWVLEPIATSEQKHGMAIPGRTGQPGSLAETPDVHNTNNCRCSLRSWYFLINAQIQTGCCVLIPKGAGLPSSGTDCVWPLKKPNTNAAGPSWSHRDV